MAVLTIKYKLSGVAPLLMHSGALVDPLNQATKELKRVTSKRFKTEADHQKVAMIEWHAGIWSDNEKPCLPADAIEAALVSAGRMRKMASRVQAGVICPSHALLQYDGPTTVKELWDDPQFQLRKPVRVGNKRVMRTRPRFPTWWAEVDIQVLSTVVDVAVVDELLRLAGNQVGLGDWRPRYGRFTVERISAGQ